MNKKRNRPQPKTPTRPRRDCFFGLHHDFHPHARDTELYADLTEEMVENVLRKVKPDFVQFDCKGHPGYVGYSTRLGNQCPGIARDALAVWRKVTRRHGVGLYIHYSGVWDSLACQRHPEWARVDEKGKSDRDATSTFGRYVNKLLIPQLREVADRYDLDGVWVDGECWAVQPDYSKAALDAFRRATGMPNVPRKKEDRHWREFIDFQRKQFLRYVRTYVNALHAQRPGFQIGSNWLFTSFLPEPVTVPVDYLSGDVPVGLDQLRLEARYLSSTGMPWDTLLVHLINTSADPRADDCLIVDEIPPVGPLVVEIQTPHRPRRVRFSPSGTKLNWGWAKGRVRVTIPQLAIHGTVMVE